MAGESARPLCFLRSSESLEILRRHYKWLGFIYDETCIVYSGTDPSGEWQQPTARPFVLTAALP